MKMYIAETEKSVKQNALDDDPYGCSRIRTSMGGSNSLDHKRLLVALRYLGVRCNRVGRYRK